MKAQELCDRARAFLSFPSCYLLGFWGQYLSQAEYNRVNIELAKTNRCNDKYGNQKYIGTDIYPFDCINFVKGLLGGCKVGTRISYKQMAANPVGDCTPEQFLAKLYDRCDPGMNVPAGYGIAKPGHAALSLGNGYWIDASFNSQQNGLMLHAGGIPAEYTCGKIPGVDYSDQPVPEPGDADDFRDYLIEHAGETINALYKEWRKTNA